MSEGQVLVQSEENEKQMKAIEKYTELQIKEQFFKLHYRSLNLIISIKDAFPLYFYMCDNITRGRGRHPFWNERILPYYHQGYLPFAKHQENMAADLGVSQGTISNHLRELEKHDLIARLGTEYISDKRPMGVWSMGHWTEDDKGRKSEIYYLQAISFV